MFNETILYLSLSNLFSYVNLALGCAILLYLRHFISYQQIAQRSAITTFVPILSREQSYLFVTGFTLWTVALLMETVRGSDFLVLPGAIRTDIAFFVHLSRPALLAASTMYIAHALMVFAAQPVLEGKRPPNLRWIKQLRRIGLFVVAVAWMAPILIGPERFDSIRNWHTFQFGLVAAQWLVMTHVFLNIRYSAHPLKQTIHYVLVIWAINVPAQMAWFTSQDIAGRPLHSLFTLDTPSGAWFMAGITTITLLVFLSMLLRANFLYVQETFRRAGAFKREKEVMIDFLNRISKRGAFAEARQASASGPIQSILERQDVSDLLSLVLEFGKEIVGANAGAIYVRDDLRELLIDPRHGDGRGRSLSALAIIGLYPPHLDPGPLPDDPIEKLHTLHEMVRAEKIRVGKGPIGEVARSGVALLEADIEDDRYFPQLKHEQLRVYNFMASPLMIQNRVIAVLCFINKDHGRTPFSDEDETTVAALAEQVAIVLVNMVAQNALREQEHLTRGMELAREVQRLLLPAENPKIPGYDLAALSAPALDVGGDYYDVLLLDEDNLLLVMADVSDKGIPGALNMASVRSALRTYSLFCSSAKSLLVDLNHFIQPDIRRGMFVSMILVIVHLPSGRLEIARAGHEPLIIQRANGEFELICPGGMALGVIDGRFFKSQIDTAKTDMRPGDRIVLYTDGITESMNERSEEFDKERFYTALRDNLGQPAQRTIADIQRRVESFAGSVAQHDDITLLILERSAEGEL